MSCSNQSVWILLLNWNNAKDTIDCLNSIYTCNDEEIAGIVVCDNGSTDGSILSLVDWLQNNERGYEHLLFSQDSSFECINTFVNDKPARPLYLIENQKNLGFAGGNNVGIEFIQEK